MVVQAGVSEEGTRGSGVLVGIHQIGQMDRLEQPWPYFVIESDPRRENVRMEVIPEVISRRLCGRLKEGSWSGMLLTSW